MILKLGDTEVTKASELLEMMPVGPDPTWVKLLTAVLMPMVDSVKYLGVHIDDDLKYGT